MGSQTNWPGQGPGPEQTVTELLASEVFRLSYEAVFGVQLLDPEDCGRFLQFQLEPSGSHGRFSSLQRGVGHGLVLELSWTGVDVTGQPAITTDLHQAYVQQTKAINYLKTYCFHPLRDE